MLLRCMFPCAMHLCLVHLCLGSLVLCAPATALAAAPLHRATTGQSSLTLEAEIAGAPTSAATFAAIDTAAAPAAAAPAATSAALFTSALADYDAGLFTAAAHAFVTLAQTHPASGWLLYNWGNSALRAGELGTAIAAYRRSLALLPREGRVRANLREARARTPDATAVPDVPPWLRMLLFWHFACSRTEALHLAALCTSCFWAWQAVALWRPGGRLGRLARVACLVMALAFVASWAVRDPRMPATIVPRTAVVLATSLAVRTADTDAAPVHFVLHAGAEAWVRTQLDGWLLLELSDGKKGWARQESVAQLAF